MKRIVKNAKVLWNGKDISNLVADLESYEEAPLLLFRTQGPLCGMTFRPIFDDSGKATHFEASIGSPSNTPALEP